MNSVFKETPAGMATKDTRMLLIRFIVTMRFLRINFLYATLGIVDLSRHLTALFRIQIQTCSPLQMGTDVPVDLRAAPM